MAITSTELHTVHRVAIPLGCQTCQASCMHFGWVTSFLDNSVKLRLGSAEDTSTTYK